jgi:dihydroxyacetone kinase
MTKSFWTVALVSTGLAVAPAHALGLDDLAKVVLKGGSVLKQGETKCGAPAKLSTGDTLKLAFARAAAERAIPVTKFMELDAQSAQEAATEAQASTFCTEAPKKKKSLIKKIGDAGKLLAKAKGLGGL